MGDQMFGMITAGPYSAAHDSALNKTYVAAMLKTNGFRPDFVSLGAYDGLHLIYEALKKTGGNSDIVSDIYIRKVVKKDGQLWSEEFETYPSVKDPMKVAAAK